MRTTLIFLLLLTAPVAWAHGTHGTYTVGEAVIVTFSGHEEGDAAGWAYTVVAPDGSDFARGMCDGLGRAVFAPDRQGQWKVRVYSPDGHGGEVLVDVDMDLSVDPDVPVTGRVVWWKWLAVIAVALALVRLLGRLRRS